MIGTTDDELLDEQAERIAVLEAENARLRAALKRITATPRDCWKFRDGHVIGEVHLIAAEALEQRES